MPYIDVERDTGSFVKALIDAPAPTQILAFSEWATPSEWLALWSQVTGVATRIEQADTKEFEGNDPSGFMRSILETGQFVAKFGFTGKDEQILMPEDVSLTFEEFGVSQLAESTNSLQLKEQGFAITQSKLTDYMSCEDWSSILN